MIEKAWVIEKASSARENPQFFGGMRKALTGVIWAHWTYDKIYAVRFCRKIDAESINLGFAADGQANRIKTQLFDK